MILEDNKPRALCVDDEPNVLSGFVRHLRRDFQVLVAESGEEGLQVVREEPNLAVICSDFNMTGMDGVAFLKAARVIQPDATRLLLTGRTDLNIAVDSINQGGIFRFMLKPCPPELLLQTFHEAARQHQLITGERDLLERTLAGSVRLLLELLTHANPIALSRGTRIRQTVQRLMESLPLQDKWKYETAAALSQIGCLALAPDLREKVNAARPLTPPEQERYAEHPRLAAHLLQHIPRMEEIAAMIAGQGEPFELNAQTANLARLPATQLGALLIKLAVAYDDLRQTGKSHEQVMSIIKGRSREFHPQMLMLLDVARPDRPAATQRQVTVAELRTRMIIMEEVRAMNGVLLISRGQEVTTSILERLRQVAAQVGIQEPITVQLPTSGNSAMQAA